MLGPVRTGIPLALSIDQAPSVGTSAHTAFDPARLDRVREQLARAGIRYCTAFVVGSRSRGHEASLERWLEAGYELGNCGFDHPRASQVGRAEFIAQLKRSDALLRGLGAFDGHRPRFFRFPFGDRGPDAATRRELLQACHDLGYTVADVSIDLFDRCYEAPLAAALCRDRARAHAIERRYLANAEGQVQRAGRIGLSRWGGRHVHIAACEFGLLNERCLPELLRRLGSLVSWKPLALAVFQPAYLRFQFDYERNGAIGEQLHRGLFNIALRPLARLSRRARFFDQPTLGPRWPHLTG
jgi:hypothetical protein